MKKINLNGKKKLFVKIIAGIVAVAVIGTGIGYGAVYAKNKKSETADDKKENGELTKEDKESDAKEDTEDQADLLTNIIKSQVGGESTDTGKEENVYVISDANGAPTKVIVSDWIKNPKAADTLKDASDLTDITNVKGDETFKQSKNGDLSWAADGKDIYYQGSTDKKLPVSVKVTYYLNGKETKPEDMIGKSGNVKIRFDYDNEQTEKIDINGKEEEVYVPFTVMSAMMLPTDTFTDITVTNGKVMSEGLNNIVMGLAFPGLKDSLQLNDDKLKEKDIEIPDYVEVNAVTSNFSLDMTLSVVLSDALSDIHLTDSIDLSEVDDDMDKLTDASSELEDGTKQLKEGVDTLNSKTTEFQNGAKKLDDGIVSYTNGVASLSDGITTLKNGTQSASDGASKLASGAADAKSGVDKLAEGASSLATGASDVSNGVNTLTGQVNALVSGIMSNISQMESGIEQVNAGLSATTDPEVQAQLEAQLQTLTVQKETLEGVLSELGDLSELQEKEDLLTAGASGLATGASNLSSGIENLQSGLSDLSSGANDLNSGISQLNSGADQLKTGVDTLTSNSAALVSGASTLYDGTSKLADGVSKLQTGANDLNTGMIKFDKEGIAKLTDAFEGEGKTVLDRLNATMDAGHNYHTFTKLPEGMEGSVKFIIRTDAVK